MPPCVRSQTPVDPRTDRLTYDHSGKILFTDCAECRQLVQTQMSALRRVVILSIHEAR